MVPAEFTVQFEIINLLTSEDYYPQQTATINYSNDCGSSLLAFTFNGCDDANLGSCASLDPVLTYNHYAGVMDL